MSNKALREEGSYSLDSGRWKRTSEEDESVDVLEAILTRRSIRRFLNKPVDREVLEQILKAGSCAPSAENRPPWCLT